MNDRDPDAYHVPSDGPEIELRVQGSRFLARVWTAPDEESVAAGLDDARRRYHDATHHCWAHRAAPPAAPRERHDDDGEPAGTAGVPILAAIRQADLVDALVVVTRYFGGTKLGTGGLARAYGEAAREALTAAGRKIRWNSADLVLVFGFDDVGTVETVVARSAGAILDVERRFDPEPGLRLTVKHSLLDEIRSRLIEATAGRVTFPEPGEPEPG